MHTSCSQEDPEARTSTMTRTNYKVFPGCGFDHDQETLPGPSSIWFVCSLVRLTMSPHILTLMFARCGSTGNTCLGIPAPRGSCTRFFTKWLVYHTNYRQNDDRSTNNAGLQSVRQGCFQTAAAFLFAQKNGNPLWGVAFTFQLTLSSTAYASEGGR